MRCSESSWDSHAVALHARRIDFIKKNIEKLQENVGSGPLAMKFPRPIPPRSIVRLSRLWPHARRKGHKIGEIWRIGYYSRQDGLDCIWLVNSEGEYHWPADHDWLEKHFDVVMLSNESDFHGASRPVLEPFLHTASRAPAAKFR